MLLVHGDNQCLKKNKICSSSDVFQQKVDRLKVVKTGAKIQ